MVKTILQTNKPVDIAEFYVPASILSDGKIVTPSSANDLNSRHCLLQGVAGQGKSTFLRYLASVELSMPGKLPLFGELRRVEHYGSLKSLLLQTALDIGLRSIDSTSLESLLDQGHCSLFLDGFDEVPDHLKSMVATEIESLCYRHINARVIVSSRPSSSLRGSGVFSVNDLVPLYGDGFDRVVYKYCDASTAAALIRGIRSERQQLLSVLVTPLMVALLVVRYRASPSIPDTIAEFYEFLFDLLMQRHDGLKPGFSRPRKSGLPEVTIERAFESTCFLTRKAQRSELKRREAISYMGEALRLEDAPSELAEKTISDIADTTSLVVEDGGVYSFVHNSVQEFYAASFVRRQPQETARLFYGAMRSSWHKWAQELSFLRTIDSVRFWQFFGIDSLLQTTGCKDLTQVVWWEPSDEWICSTFGDEVVVRESLTPSSSQKSFAVRIGRDGGGDFYPRHWALDGVSLLVAILSISEEVADQLASMVASQGTRHVPALYWEDATESLQLSLADLLQTEESAQWVRSACQPLTRRLNDMAEEAQAVLRSVKRQALVFDLT